MENFLLETLLQLPRGFFKNLGPQVDQVTLPQVNQALRDFIDLDNLSIVIVGTAGKIKASVAKNLGVDESKILVRPYTEE